MTQSIRWNQSLVEGGSTVLLDVRTPAEFAEVHVASSKNVPLSDLPRHVAALDKSPHYVIVCRSGRRAEQASKLLAQHGLNCSVLAGGIVALPSNAALVRATTTAVMPLDRQVQLTFGLLLVFAGLATLLAHKVFVLIALSIGCGLIYAGMGGTCGLAVLLSKAPWNQSAGNTSTCCSDSQRGA